MKSFRPKESLAVLERERVDYVVIGGLASILHGANTFTRDLAICPLRTPENLERLAKALRELHARIRTDDAPDGLPFACDASFFRTIAMVNLVTDNGDLDVAFQPSGTTGYDELSRRAERLALDDVETVVASLADVIRSKEAANRPKDQASLPALRTLLAEIRRRGGPGV